MVFSCKFATCCCIPFALVRRRIKAVTYLLTYLLVTIFGWALDSQAIELTFIFVALMPDDATVGVAEPQL